MTRISRLILLVVLALLLQGFVLATPLLAIPVSVTPSLDEQWAQTAEWQVCWALGWIEDESVMDLEQLASIVVPLPTPGPMPLPDYWIKPAPLSLLPPGLSQVALVGSLDPGRRFTVSQNFAFSWQRSPGRSRWLPVIRSLG
ncbi:MAG: hypothetical protein NTV81_02300 [Candidatus Komeilibacteria bacterium]|nr:hypothetical protein [Candidatus Komeilibacteria bacterium]